jgi:hypothetical protein
MMVQNWKGFLEIPSFHLVEYGYDNKLGTPVSRGIAVRLKSGVDGGQLVLESWTSKDQKVNTKYLPAYYEITSYDGRITWYVDHGYVCQDIDDVVFAWQKRRARA